MSRQTPSGTLSVTRLCALFGLSRAGYYAAAPAPHTADAAGRAHQTDPGNTDDSQRSARGIPTEALVTSIRDIVAANPAWGVRKVWATLRREGVRVGTRRVWALMKAHCLTFPPERTAPGAPTRGTVAVELPDRRWATDLTTVWTRRDGVVAIVPVVDCGCRSVLALAVMKAQDAGAVLMPVEQALWREFGSPSRVPDGLELRTDHGPQYTSDHAHGIAEKWGVEQTFAPVGRPTGNALAERTIRTMKEECLWLRDWESLAEVEAALTAWKDHFNTVRPHQALDWETPAERRARLLGHAQVAA